MEQKRVTEQGLLLKRNDFRQKFPHAEKPISIVLPYDFIRTEAVVLLLSNTADCRGTL